MEPSRTPFGTLMYFEPGDIRGPLPSFYASTRRDILGTDLFTAAPLQGQLIHSAFIAGGKGIAGLIPPASLVIADAWNSQSEADRAITTLIRPTLQSAGHPDPRSLNFELIGCFGNPEATTDIHEDGAVANIQTWPDLGIDAAELYNAVIRRMLAEAQPLVDGGATHLAFRYGHNQILTLEIWRNRTVLLAGTHDRIMPAVRQVFEQHAIKGDPTEFSGSPLGIALGSEVRHPHD